MMTSKVRLAPPAPGWAGTSRLTKFIIRSSLLNTFRTPVLAPDELTIELTDDACKVGLDLERQQDGFVGS
jgi:hypothetical protein